MARRCSARSHVRGDPSIPMRVAAVLFVTALTAAAAQVSIPLPFTPVPFTLQPMVVLLGGAAALGSRLGMASQVLYLLAGIAGLPVFAASPRAAAGSRPAARPDRRLPHELSVRRVRRRLARRTQLRSPLPDVRPRDGLRPRRHFRLRRLLARLVRATIARRAFAPRSAPGCTRSWRPTLSRSRSPRPCSRRSGS